MSVLCIAKVDRRLRIRGPYNPQIRGLYDEIPCRWDRRELCWTCDATPAAAHRLLNESPVQTEADEATRRLAIAHSTLALLRAAVVQGTWPQPPQRKLDLWRHQLAAYHFAKAGEAVMLSLAMGTGKTAVAIALAVNHNWRTVLVLCPVSVLGVWRREWARHSPVEPALVILDAGTVRSKAKAVQRALDLASVQAGATVIVANYESAWRKELADVLLAHRWGGVVLDESHRCKAHSSSISKFCYKLGRTAERRLCLTGTPLGTNGPADAFGQYRFLDPAIFGTSIHRFRCRYAKMNPHIPQKVDAWINEHEFAERFASIAFRVESDVLDLPGVQHIRRECVMTPRGRGAYEQMREQMIVEIAEGTLTAQNGMVKLLRLQQMTGGSMPVDGGAAVEIDDAKAKLLADLLADVGESAVVFCRFRHDLAVVQRIAGALDRRYGEISGRRKDLTPQGTMPNHLDVMGVQIASGGVGIDLTHARIGVYYSLGYSLVDYEQSLARIHRPGQTRPVVYYHLVCAGTVDETVYKAIAGRRDVVQSILEALKT